MEQIELIRSIVIAIYIAFFIISTQITIALLIKEIITRTFNKNEKQKANNKTK